MTSLICVYVAESGDYEQRGIDGIYSSREKALKAFPNSDVTIYPLDGADIAQVPCWWEVSYLPGKTGRGKRKWDARNFRSAGAEKQEQEVIWRKWAGTSPNFPRDGRVAVTVWASTAKEAIALAKAQIRGTIIPIWTYNYSKPNGPWHRAGEGIAL